MEIQKEESVRTLRFISDFIPDSTSSNLELCPAAPLKQLNQNRFGKPRGEWVSKGFPSPGPSRSCAAFHRLTFGHPMALSDPSDQAEPTAPSP